MTIIKNKSLGRQGGELNQKPLPTCPALIWAQCSPSLSVCQKSGLVPFFVSFESQPSVCSFNCAQRPSSLGDSGRGGLIRVTWQGSFIQDCPLCSDGPVQLRSLTRFHSQKANHKEINEVCKLIRNVLVQVVRCKWSPAESTPLSDTLYSLTKSPRETLQLKTTLQENSFVTHYCLSPELVCRG